MSKQEPWSVGFREPMSITLDGPQGLVAFRVVPAGMVAPPMHLISAAPAMLAALEGVLRVADRATDEFDAARAAIAKANGINPGAAWPFPSYKKPQP